MYNVNILLVLPREENWGYFCMIIVMMMKINLLNGLNLSKLRLRAISGHLRTQWIESW